MLRDRYAQVYLTVKQKKPLRAFLGPGAPMEIRTPVLALKGLRPSPLDDGGIELKFYHDF